MGGTLCHEPLRGIRYNLLDAKIHSCYAGQLASSPKLYEPMYIVDIEVPNDSQNIVFDTLGKCRGEFIDVNTDKLNIGIPLVRMKAFVPILETLKESDGGSDFIGLLRGKTKGKAFSVTKFSHWQKVAGCPLVDGSISNKFVMETRRRKGMKLEIPSFNDYYDKL